MTAQWSEVRTRLASATPWCGLLGQARKWRGVLLEFTETLLPISEEDCVQTNDADGQQDDHGMYQDGN